MNLLAIDFGTSKTAALFIECKGKNMLKTAEFVFGNNQITNKRNFNIVSWQNSLEQILKNYQDKKNFKNCEIVISLPGVIINLEQAVYPQKNFNLSKLLRAKEKGTKDKLLWPVVNNPEAEQIKVFWPSLSKEIFEKITNAFKQYRLKQPLVFYPLPFYQKYAETGDFALINLGGRSTDLLIYKNNNLQKISNIPVGGEQVIHDISVVSQIAENEARDNFFNFSKLFESRFNQSDDLLTKIIDERVKELFNLIKQELNIKPETIYLFGGLANCPKLSQYLENYLKIKIVNLNEKINRTFLFEQAYLLAENFLKLK